MRKRILTEEGFERFRKSTCWEQFIDEVDRIIAWDGLCGVIEPLYPKGEGSGAPPIDVERMPHIYFLQHCFNLSGAAVEEMLYDS